MSLPFFNYQHAGRSKEWWSSARPSSARSSMARRMTVSKKFMARQIDTPEKFLRLLALLIGFASGSGGDFAATGFGPGSWSAGAGNGVLELLARALSETPESIDHLEPIVERLRRMPNGGVILPPGWDDVWLPVLAARRSMLEVQQ